MSFVVDPRLVGISVRVTELALSQVRLMNDERVPWAMVIPQVRGVTELHQLTPDQNRMVAAEIRSVSAALAAAFPCDKVNIGMFGHGVPQLHIHVAARRHDDAAWPRPIFMTEGPARDPELTASMATQLRLALERGDR